MFFEKKTSDAGIIRNLYAKTSKKGIQPILRAIYKNNLKGNLEFNVMEIKEHSCGDHWVLYGSDEPLNSTSETKKCQIK